MSRRVLLIADRCGPADALRIRPLVESVCASNPEVHFELVCSEQAAPVLSEVEGIRRTVVSRLYGLRVATGWRSRARKAVELARLLSKVGLGLDQAVILLWGGAYVSLLARLAARRAVGFRTAAAFLLETPVGPYLSAPDYEQNLALLTAAGLRVDAPRLRVNARAIAAGRDVLAGRRRDEAFLVVLHPGSDWACQQWRPERWARLMDALWERWRPDIAITGTESDAEHVARIAALTSAPHVNLVGATSLPQLEGVLSQAAVCVCVDSVANDVAQAAGVPAVVLAGPSAAWVSPLAAHPPLVVNNTDPADRRWISGCQDGHTEGRCQDWSCPFAGLPAIQVDEVLRGVERALAAKASGAAPADEEQVVPGPADQRPARRRAVEGVDGAAEGAGIRPAR